MSGHSTPIEKKRLTSVDKNSIIELFNNPLVKRHMPLSADLFDDNHYQAFIAAKEALWETCGFGPYAYFIKDTFIGWGGIQPEAENFELALVLAPAYWGYGKQIYRDLIHQAFIELKLGSVTILFPPSRKKIKGIFKVGFVEEGSVTIDGKVFIRFRLLNPYK